MAEISNDVQRAIEELTNGELIGFPTETVYGLAGNAFKESSILKIFETKNRPTFDPLIVHTLKIQHLFSLHTCKNNSFHLPVNKKLFLS
jgi:L-threonylcarbamoyladenylate synthase